jgi:hypothetical protein
LGVAYGLEVTELATPLGSFAFLPGRRFQAVFFKNIAFNSSSVRSQIVGFFSKKQKYLFLLPELEPAALAGVHVFV